MKKRWLVITGILVILMGFGAVALANSPIKILVDGKEIKTQVSPQVMEGRVMVPIRYIAEALGTNVEWNQNTRTVRINDEEKQNLKRRLEELESAVIPTSAKEAALSWGKAVKNRNGALQYAILSPELQEKYRGYYQNSNWVTGVSSPGVESFDIIDAKESDNTGEFTISYKLITSTGSAGSCFDRITTQRLNNGWHITKLNSHDKSLELYGIMQNLLDKQYQHYRVLNQEITQQSLKISDYQVEAEYQIKVITVPNVATPAEWPSIKGMNKYLQDNAGKLSPAAVQKVKEQIAFWNKEIQGYIDQPADGYDAIQIRVKTDNEDNIVEESVRFYRDDGAGKFLPLDMNGPQFQTNQQLTDIWYNEMKQLTEGTK